MPSNQSEQPFDTAQHVKAFCARILLNSLSHALRGEIDAVHVRRFQSLGFMDGAKPPPLPADTVEILLNPKHPKRVRTPAGPLVFIRDAARSLIAAEVAPLLLNESQDVRLAAVKYLQGRCDSKNWILTPHTRDFLEKALAEIQASEIVRWRKAGTDLIPVIRDDYFGHIAGLKQSLVAAYQDGTEEFAIKVLRPSLASLASLLPPIWCATEQRDEIEARISEFAKSDTFPAALTSYSDYCGYLPLCTELSARELARQWGERHADKAITWADISSWAAKCGTPLSKFHAITIALGFPSARPNKEEGDLWSDVQSVLDLASNGDSACDSHFVWILYCELAAHFTRHVEALHPGQYGERVACFAWWLVSLIGPLFGVSSAAAKHSLDTLVSYEGRLSFHRWTIARSPTAPSAFRYGTLFQQSIWATSLVVHLDKAAPTIEFSDISQAIKTCIASIGAGYLVSYPLHTDPQRMKPTFAIDENSTLAGLVSNGAAAPEDLEMLDGLSALRIEMSGQFGFKSWLERLCEPEIGGELVFADILRATVFSTNRFDEIISDWLNRTADVVKAIQLLPEGALEPFIEALSEFQQRPRADLPIHLPHILAFAAEQTDDPARFGFLHVHVILMSINAGIASPIQRIATSKWKADSLKRLKIWRENIVFAARFSEPWVASRVRATSAVISRIIGPRETGSGDGSKSAEVAQQE